MPCRRARDPRAKATKVRALGSGGGGLGDGSGGAAGSPRRGEGGTRGDLPRNLPGMSSGLCAILQHWEEKGAVGWEARHRFWSWGKFAVRVFVRYRSVFPVSVGLSKGYSSSQELVLF